MQGLKQFGCENDAVVASVAAALNRPVDMAMA
jgi:hypothetical protein